MSIRSPRPRLPRRLLFAISRVVTATFSFRRDRMRIQRSLLTLIIAFSACGAGTAQEPAADSLLRRILQSLTSRQDQLNPMIVTYELECFESRAWELAQRVHDPREHSWKVQASFACKGEKTKSWANRQHPRAAHSLRESFVLYNGEVEIREANNPNEYLLTRRPSNTRIAETPFDITGESGFLETLRQWSTGNDRLLCRIHEPTVINGKAGLFLELHYPSTKWTNKCWILPDEGYFMPKLEIYGARSELVSKSEVFQVDNVTGLMLPTRGIRHHFLPSGELATKVLFNVTAYDLQPAHVSDALFSFDFPKDAHIFDVDRRTTVRNSVASESYLDEVVLRARTPASVWRNPYFIAGGVAALLVLIGFWFWKRSKSRMMPLRNAQSGASHA